MYLLYFIPKNWVSFITGWVVRLKCPSFLQTYINWAFVRVFSINMSEALHTDPSDYASIEDLFTRAIIKKSRIIKGPYASSADGQLVISKPVEKGEQALQAKGLTYNIQDLIYGRGQQIKEGFHPSWYTTVYLAPHNYHRVHAPFTGKLLSIRYVPGELWPVNTKAVNLIPNLFVRNERLIFDFELAEGAKAWVVMVGALNVGRMTTRFKPDFVTNSLTRQLDGGRARPAEMSFRGEKAMVNIGDELGIFMLGSTTVVVLDAKARELLKPTASTGPRSILMGESLSV